MIFSRYLLEIDIYIIQSASLGDFQVYLFKIKKNYQPVSNKKGSNKNSITIKLLWEIKMIRGALSKSDLFQ